MSVASTLVTRGPGSATRRVPARYEPAFRALALHDRSLRHRSLHDRSPHVPGAGDPVCRDPARRDRAFPAGVRPAGAPLVDAVCGAALMGISPERFARLARTGCLAPVEVQAGPRGVVVWRYAAAELRTFAERFPALLRGPAPEELRAALRRGEDHRPRRWRARLVARLVRQAGAPWRRAAALALVLDPPTLAAEVPDAGERALLCRLRPRLSPAGPAGAGGDPVRRFLAAADPDEIRKYRRRLARALRQARGTPAVGPL